MSYHYNYELPIKLQTLLWDLPIGKKFGWWLTAPKMFKMSTFDCFQIKHYMVSKFQLIDQLEFSRRTSSDSASGRNKDPELKLTSINCSNDAALLPMWLYAYTVTGWIFFEAYIRKENWNITGRS